jgi:hypothetical protein
MTLRGLGPDGSFEHAPVRGYAGVVQRSSRDCGQTLVAAGTHLRLPHDPVVGAFLDYPCSDDVALNKGLAGGGVEPNLVFDGVDAAADLGSQRAQFILGTDLTLEDELSLRNVLPAAT